MAPRECITAPPGLSIRHHAMDTN